MKVLLIAIFASMTANAMAANKKEFTVASFNITPCSKVFHYKDSFGIKWPSLRTSRQSTDLVVTIKHAPKLAMGRLVAAHNDCSNLALAVGGITFISNPPFFKAAYDGTYGACMYGRFAGEITGIGVTVKNKCHW